MVSCCDVTIFVAWVTKVWTAPNLVHNQMNPGIIKPSRGGVPE
jgi:hypothetical protein